MATNIRITCIVVREHADDLFDGQDTSGVDVAASAQAFYDLLAGELRRRYPDAAVAVIEHHVTSSKWQRVIVETEPDGSEPDEQIVGVWERAVRNVRELASSLWDVGGRWIVFTDETNETDETEPATT